MNCVLKTCCLLFSHAVTSQWNRVKDLTPIPIILLQSKCFEITLTNSIFLSQRLKKTDHLLLKVLHTIARN